MPHRYFTCVCVCACVCACVCVCMYVCMNVCMCYVRYYGSIGVFQVLRFAFSYEDCVCMYVCIACVCTYMYVTVCMCTHVFIFCFVSSHAAYTGIPYLVHRLHLLYGVVVVVVVVVVSSPHLCSPLCVGEPDYENLFVYRNQPSESNKPGPEPPDLPQYKEHKGEGYASLYVLRLAHCLLSCTSLKGGMKVRVVVVVSVVDVVVFVSSHYFYHHFLWL